VLSGVFREGKNTEARKHRSTEHRLWEPVLQWSEFCDLCSWSFFRKGENTEARKHRSTEHWLTGAEIAISICIRGVNNMFFFENLEVYKCSIEFYSMIYTLKKRILDRTIKDQLSRAALSISLNIAEGQGRMHSPEKRQFYNTAKGSTYECVPLIKICCAVGFFNREEYEKLDLQLNGIAKLLSGLINSLVNRKISDN
jgi:four helix bundle protein